MLRLGDAETQRALGVVERAGIIKELATYADNTVRFSTFYG